MKSKSTEASGREGATNRTGIMFNPELSAELILGAEAATRSGTEGGAEVTDQATYLTETAPIGSLPAMVADDGEANGSISILLDKLGERLAFERQGTRLYQAFVQKVEALGDGASAGPSSEELRHICEEELQHFRLLQKIITELGGDATVQTPSADVVGVLSHGMVQVVSDPRTTIAQCLQAVLTAELADNDGWQMLSALAEAVGNSDLVDQCEKAFEEEQEHLEDVRAWLNEMTANEAANASNADIGKGDAETERADAGTKRRRTSSKSTGSRAKKSKKRRKK
ncbi:MAG TPA: ferritin-like domain-containing protein [Candidatus Binatia bacterium]|nr:ferritin-like domain-containing protein [Candidatus Binatia bacterium]